MRILEQDRSVIPIDKFIPQRGNKSRPCREKNENRNEPACQPRRPATGRSEGGPESRPFCRLQLLILGTHGAAGFKSALERRLFDATPSNAAPPGDRGPLQPRSE